MFELILDENVLKISKWNVTSAMQLSTMES